MHRLKKKKEYTLLTKTPISSKINRKHTGEVSTYFVENKNNGIESHTIYRNPLSVLFPNVQRHLVDLII